jgi:hypothetical protein
MVHGYRDAPSNVEKGLGAADNISFSAETAHVRLFGAPGVEPATDVDVPHVAGPRLLAFSMRFSRDRPLVVASSEL